MTSSQAIAQLESATAGFDFLLNNDLNGALAKFESEDSPFHHLGLGVTNFLQAALGLEDNLMAEATKSLTSAEADAKRQAKSAKASSTDSTRAFPAGMEWDVLQADATVLLGITQALTESYSGYLQCMWSLNSAHGKFTKLFNVVFPNGLDAYDTPAPSADTTPSSSTPSSASSSAAPSIAESTKTVSSSLFGRWGSKSTSRATTPATPIRPQNPIDYMILGGTAFGFGLFNLAFSLLPAKVKKVVGILGFQSDRKLALRALAVAAKSDDVHARFAACLSLMTYYGIILLLSGFQADEAKLIRTYDEILKTVEDKYPHGTLWILNRAKLQRYTGNNSQAILTLQGGLSPSSNGPAQFRQTDALLVFELGWILLAERRYEEAAAMFLRMQELNTWSHATYSFLAAGCYLSLNTPEALVKAQVQFDKLPGLLEQKQIGGRSLPTEVLIRKKIAMYKKKQLARGGKESAYAECVKFSPAEELGIIWNTHGRLSKPLAEGHIKELVALTPPVTIPSPYYTDSSSAAETASSAAADLELPDEFTARSLLLGILHRATKDYTASRAFLEQATTENAKQVEGQWMINTAYFELAVLVLLVASDEERSTLQTGDVNTRRTRWAAVLNDASAYLDKAAQGTAALDLGSRLESRIALLRDEIQLKKTSLGI